MNHYEYASRYGLTPEQCDSFGVTDAGNRIRITFFDNNGVVIGAQHRKKRSPYRLFKGCFFNKFRRPRWGPHHGSDVGCFNITNDPAVPVCFVESPSEGLALAARGVSVVFSNGAFKMLTADSVSRWQSWTAHATKRYAIGDHDSRGRYMEDALRNEYGFESFEYPECFKDLDECLRMGGGVALFTTAQHSAPIAAHE